jgi:hypothetical protein
MAHLMQLAAEVPTATLMDLQRIMGYIAWLAYAMGWPMFMATLVCNRNTYWIYHFHNNGFLHQPRRLAPRLLSRQIHTDATPVKAAAVFLGPPKIARVFAIEGIIWCCSEILDQPTTVTLFTDSTIVFSTTVKGKGLTLRASPLLQDRFVKMYRLMNKAGHSLVAMWFPSNRNLADPLT